MSDRPFLDTNILVYAIGEDPKRTPRAEALLRQGGIISVQVLNELAAVVYRKLNMSWAEIAEALTSLRALCPAPAALTVETHERALSLAATYGFQIYDALIVASALEADCDELFSEDLAGRPSDRRQSHDPQPVLPHVIPAASGGCYPKSEIGRDDWIRTSDPLTPSQVRYQAALHPEASHCKDTCFASGAVSFCPAP